MIRVLALSQEDNVSVTARVEEPARYLERDGEFRVDVRFWGEDAPHPRDIDRYDLVYIIRCCHIGMVPFIRSAVGRGCKVILDYDDLLGDQGRDRDVVHELARTVHGITGITPELVNHYHGLVPVCAWHNGIDFDDPLYQERLPPVPDRPVLFLGHGVMDENNALMMRAVLQEVMRQDPGILLKFVGHEQFLAGLQLPADRVIAPPKTASHGLPVREFLKSMSMAELMLVPSFWGDCPQGKGFPRLLHGAAWGVPSIYSPLQSVKRFHRESGGGVRIVHDNSVAGWIEAIQELMGDHGLRIGMGERARETVRERYSVDVQAERLASFFRQVLGAYA